MNTRCISCKHLLSNLCIDFAMQVCVIAFVFVFGEDSLKVCCFCHQILALFLHQVRLFPTPQRCTNFPLARSHQPINTLKRGCSIPLIGRRGQNRGLFAMSKDSPYKYCLCYFVLGQSVFVFSSGEPCSGFCSAGRPSPAPAGGK